VCSQLALLERVGCVWIPAFAFCYFSSQIDSWLCTFFNLQKSGTSVIL
jgi:hypothetical protein